MSERRVAITGLGVVSPAGIGVGPFWESLLAARRCVKTISLFDASKFPSSIAGQLDDFSARNFVPKDYRKSVKVMARDIEIAVAAADLAFRDAGMVTRSTNPNAMTYPAKRMGCNVGAGLICTDLDELGMAVNTAVTDGRFDMRAWGTRGMTNLNPLWLLKYLPNMLSCHVTIIHGTEGPSNCITCGDASGLLAAGESARLIARGGADAAVAGGAESKLNPMGLLRQRLLNRLCTSRNDRPGEACRPFDAGHDGTVVGEGGGLIILEDLELAKARGARIYAEFVGFGAACDPDGIDVLKPTTGNLDLAVRAAMQDAGIAPEDVGIIVTQGTGVPGEDRCEARAWQEALGEAASKVPAVTTTGAIGQLFAGSGGVALVTAAKALHDEQVPPTVNFAAPADGCGLKPPRDITAIDAKYAVCGAFSVGGQSAACVLKRYEEAT